MKIVPSTFLALGLLATPLTALAAPYGYGPSPGAAEVERTGGISVGGRAPWNQPWEYDSGSGNDRRPELPYYQQGRGQQTGGPERNLLPDDRLRIFPD